MNDTIPPIHPGEILSEEFLQPLGISMNQLSRDLNISVQRVSEIVRGRRAITTDTAMRLAAYFKTSAEFWLNLQMRYDLEQAKDSNLASRISQEVRPRQQHCA
ncbi:HigA family addiction module antitoxin [Desulfocurvibacter africanus]|uniref:Plasmid maintenance system antidote protein, XRE family n=1 Tax=Desulfocurvibacter africanus subsp. africanus str. Walvis Bay TaxID=690850 RepID=F3YXH3_DESAF|nr:HigA family addiction module antitoxin [Desulfocurvibacter africanus]EGJ51750.1 plasmid maintenance system antidote protein, XRE family [Desulfocurvibacter africanus subsp. africanus str. Walvis Bay]